MKTTKRRTKQGPFEQLTAYTRERFPGRIVITGINVRDTGECYASLSRFEEGSTQRIDLHVGTRHFPNATEAVADLIARVEEQTRGERIESPHWVMEVA